MEGICFCLSHLSLSLFWWYIVPVWTSLLELNRAVPHIWHWPISHYHLLHQKLSSWNVSKYQVWKLSILFLWVLMRGIRIGKKFLSLIFFAAFCRFLTKMYVFLIVCARIRLESTLWRVFPSYGQYWIVITIGLGFTLVYWNSVHLQFYDL